MKTTIGKLRRTLNEVIQGWKAGEFEGSDPEPEEDTGDLSEDERKGKDIFNEIVCELGLNAAKALKTEIDGAYDVDPNSYANLARLMKDGDDGWSFCTDRSSGISYELREDGEETSWIPVGGF